MAKFNCILAEARWYYPYHAYFVEGHEDGDQCHCLYDDSLECFEGELDDDEAGYDRIRAVMEGFLASTDVDANGEATDDGYHTAHTADEYKERRITAWRSQDYKDEGVILFPWDQAAGSYTQKALHFTYVFQIFVFMQIFNQINARKLKEDELNVFSGMLQNRWFNIIMVVTFVV